jgi:hypothetical protein
VKGGLRGRPRSLRDAPLTLDASLAVDALLRVVLGLEDQRRLGRRDGTA